MIPPKFIPMDARKCSLKISSALSLILFANKNVFLFFDAHKQQYIIKQNNHLQTITNKFEMIFVVQMTLHIFAL